MKAHCNSVARFHLFVILFLFLSFFASSVLAQLPVLQGPNGQPVSPFAKVYEKVAPAVVKIDVQTKAARQMDPFFRQFFNIPEQQREQIQKGVGSGVIVDRDGRVLTNNHVIADAKEIEVVLNDNEKYGAEVVGTDPETDLAVIKLKLNGKQLPANYVAELGDSDQIKPGDYAIALGNPLGLDRTITVGVVSAVGRFNLPVSGGGPRYQNFIQTDAQINPGGALCDINGKVIGINDMYTAQYAGIGFAIPVNMAKSVMGKIIATGKVDRGFLGIAGKDIDRDIQNAMDLSSPEGVLVENVVAGSPAEKAGLKEGDVITAINGQKVKDYNDFSFRVAANNPGDSVKLDVLQGGTRKTVTVKLANRMEYADAGTVLSGAKGESAWRGIHVANLNDSQYQKFVPEGVTEGVLVVDIDEGSPAAESGLRDGDILTEVYIGGDHRVIKNVADFNALKEKHKNNKRHMLVYRIQKLQNGQTSKGSVTVKGE
ncbi:MAG: trypsin-like peptidase domain-containing protein [Candidatus Latescibacterota bacterium]